MTDAMPANARLRADFIQDLRKFIDNKDAIHKAVESDLYWLPEMLDLAGLADELATRLEETSPRHTVRSRLDGTGPLNGASDAPIALVPCPDSDVIATVLNDPAASFWLKRALWSALTCDPVDVANDCEHLSALLGKRADSMLSATIEELGDNPDYESL